MKRLGIAFLSGTLVLVFYWTYLHERTTLVTGNVAVQSAQSGAMWDIGTESARKYRQAGVQAAEMIRRGDYDGATRTMQLAETERERSQQILNNIVGNGLRAANDRQAAMAPPPPAQMPDKDNSPLYGQAGSGCDKAFEAFLTKNDVVNRIASPEMKVQEAALDDFKSAKSRRVNCLADITRTPEQAGQEAEKTVKKEPRIEFKLLDPNRNSYQLDARETWRDINVTGVAGATLEVVADSTSRVCSATDYCTGPDGRGYIPNNATFENFPIHDGSVAAYVLIGKWGQQGEPFVIGSHYTGTIPPNGEGQRLLVMANVDNRWETYRSANLGGYKILRASVH